MPKSTNLTTELAILTKALKGGEENVTRQYVTRVPLPLAVKFITECAAQDELPAVGLRRILETHFKQQEQGIHLDIGEFDRRVLDGICRLTGKDRESVVLDLISEYAMPKLKSLRSTLTELDEEVETRKSSRVG